MEVMSFIKENNAPKPCRSNQSVVHFELKPRGSKKEKYFRNEKQSHLQNSVMTFYEPSGYKSHSADT